MLFPLYPSIDVEKFTSGFNDIIAELGVAVPKITDLWKVLSKSKKLEFDLESLLLDSAVAPSISDREDLRLMLEQYIPLVYNSEYFYKQGVPIRVLYVSYDWRTLVEYVLFFVLDCSGEFYEDWKLTPYIGKLQRDDKYNWLNWLQVGPDKYPITRDYIKHVHSMLFGASYKSCAPSLQTLEDRVGPINRIAEERMKSDDRYNSTVSCNMPTYGDEDDDDDDDFDFIAGGSEPEDEDDYEDDYEDEGFIADGSIPVNKYLAKDFDFVAGGSMPADEDEDKDFIAGGSMPVDEDDGSDCGLTLDDLNWDDYDDCEDINTIDDSDEAEAKDNDDKVKSDTTQERPRAAWLAVHKS